MAAGPINDDQHKRTLEALERRFVLAKAEVQPKERRNNKRNLQQEPGNNPVFPSVETRSDKLATSISSSVQKKDAEVDEPIYLPISQPIHENLHVASEGSCQEKSTVDKVLHELLQSGDSAQKYMQGSKSKKMDNYILLDNFVPPQKASPCLRACQRRSKRSQKRMSMKQLKKHGSFDLPNEFHEFDRFMPMHDIWKGYMIQLLKGTGKNQVAQCLLDADLHGAILRVVSCNVNALIGAVGIMIRETAETFGILTPENKFKGTFISLGVVPKKGSVFSLQVDTWKVTLHGEKLASRKVA